jgi:hypothetical protein
VGVVVVVCLELVEELYCVNDLALDGEQEFQREYLFPLEITTNNIA